MCVPNRSWKTLRLRGISERSIRVRLDLVEANTLTRSGSSSSFRFFFRRPRSSPASSPPWRLRLPFDPPLSSSSCSSSSASSSSSSSSSSSPSSSSVPSTSVSDWEPSESLSESISGSYCNDGPRMVSESARCRCREMHDRPRALPNFS